MGKVLFKVLTLISVFFSNTNDNVFLSMSFYSIILFGTQFLIINLLPDFLTCCLFF